jgi:hypothetical protein
VVAHSVAVQHQEVAIVLGPRLRLNGQLFTWEFLWAEVRFPILGIDFLRQFDLIVDVFCEKLLSRSDVLPVAAKVFACCGHPQQGVEHSSAQPSAEAREERTAATEWSSILEEFLGVTRPLADAREPTHCVQHHILTDGWPTVAKFCRLDSAKLAAVKLEL